MVAPHLSSSMLVTRYAALLALTFALGIMAVEIAARGHSTSAWWPAAGAAAIAVLAVPRRWRYGAAAGLVVVTGLSNYVAGRPWDLSLAFGFVNAIEAFVVVALLTRSGSAPRLTTLRGVGVLVIAALVGSATAAVLAATSVTVFATGAFLGTVLSVFASHLSALLAIVPLALSWRERAHPPGNAARWLQPVILAALLLVVFGPAAQLPVAFVVFPVIVWGAFTLSAFALAIELTATAALVTTLTVLGGGPFASPDWNEFEERIVVQGFLWTFIASALVISAARTEQRASAARARRREDLLRAGISSAPIGMMLLREDAERGISVVQSNQRAVMQLGDQVTTPRSVGTDAPPIDPRDDALRAVVTAVRKAARSATAEPVTVETIARERLLELTVTRMDYAEDDALATVQVNDVTESRRKSAALQQALQDAREAAAALSAIDREREEFVASVSHELRTPITSILGFVEVLLDESEPTADQRAQLEIIERNARRLGGLVEDILALTTQAQTRAAACDLARIAAEAVEDVRVGAADRGVEVRLRDTPPAFIEGVRADVERILINLMSNAVKFSPAHGTVTVEISATNDPVRLTVTDEGPGIPPDQLDAVFERFQRGTYATEHQVPGVGLGLSMVRELAARNGFSVRLESDGDHGTTAIVEMPRTTFPDFTT